MKRYDFWLVIVTILVLAAMGLLAFVGAVLAAFYLTGQVLVPAVRGFVRFLVLLRRRRSAPRVALRQVS